MFFSGGNGSDEDENEEEEMDVDSTAKDTDTDVGKALAVAHALGRSSRGKKIDDIADGLKELDMENYDEEDEG